MSYFLTEDQELIRQVARQFTEEELKPRVNEIYGPHSHEFIREMGKRMSELGFLNVVAPEQVGGLGAPLTTLLILLEEISKESAGIGLHLMLNSTYPLILFQTPVMMQKWFGKIMSGDAVICGAMGDPAGLTNYTDWNDFAVQDGDYYILNGSRNFCTGGPYSELVFVYGLCKGTMTGFAVETGTPGYVINEEKKMGLGTTFGHLSFKNVRVHKDQAASMPMIFSDGKVQENPADGIISILNVCSIGLGLMEGVLAKTTEYLKQRITQGKPTASRGEVQHQLAKMEAQVECLRALIYDSARLVEEGKPNVRLQHMCKAIMSRDVVDVACQCQALHAGLGYCTDTGIERYVRDACGLAIGECTENMHWATIAHNLGLPDAKIGAF